MVWTPTGHYAEAFCERYFFDFETDVSIVCVINSLTGYITKV